MRKLTFFGKVLPERASISASVPKMHVHFDGVQPAYTFHIDIIHNQIIEHVVLEEDQYDRFTLKNAVESNVRAFVDFAGLLYGYGYDVEITSYVDHSDDFTFVFGIDIVGINKVGPDDVQNYLDKYMEHAIQSTYARHAFANFREAIRVPGDTGLFCYRAVENIMQHFKSLIGEVESKDDKKAWTQLRESLNVDKNWLQSIKKLSDDPMHGKATSITSVDRVTVLSKCQTLILRYLDFLRESSKALDQSQYKLLS